MKLRRKEILDFLALAGNIKSNSILPINQSIKLENGALTKTDGKTFITHEIEVDDKSAILFNENILSTFVKESKDEFIYVEVKKGKRKDKKAIWLSDSRDEDEFEWVDPKDFTKFPNSEKESETYLDADVLAAIGIASKNVLVDPDKNGETPANFDFVHISEDYVCSSDTHSMYAKKFKNLPVVSLRPDCAKTICILPYVNFYQKGNYDFFQCEKTLYAFVQSAGIKIPAIPSVVARLSKQETSEINTADIIGFCDKVIKSIPIRPNKDVVYATFEGKHLICEDSDYNINLKREMDLTGEFVPNLKFVPRKFADFFRSIGAETVTIGRSPLNPHALTVWDNDDDAMVGMITGVTLNS